jgi:hypothetical protein
MDAPEYDDYARFSGAAIALSVGELQLDARLAEVNALNRQPGQTRQPFSLLIVTESPEPLDQQIMTLIHDELGEQAMFLVPIGPQDGGMAYEAVFT